MDSENENLINPVWGLEFTMALVCLVLAIVAMGALLVWSFA